MSALSGVVTTTSSPAVPRTAPPADGPAFDLPTALARLDGDLEFLAELADLFVQESPQRLTSMATALDAEALADVERLAHTFKGAASNFAAARAVAAAQRLESAAADLDLAGANIGYRRLTDETDRLLAELGALLRSSAHARGD